MRLKSVGVALVIACGVVGPPYASAQPAPGRGDVFGTVVIQPLWDDEGSIGTGIGGGGGVRIDLSETLSVRGRVLRSRNERDFGNGVIFDLTATRYTVELLFQPSSSAHAPYFGVGTGSISFTRRSQFPNDPRRFERSDTDAVFGGLVGFSAVTTNRFRLRPEAGLWWSRPNNLIVIELGVVAAWTF